MATHEHTARRRRVHLTDSVAKRLAASGKPKVHYDDVQRGFGLRVGGRPTWVLCYSLNRREHRLTIGALSAWPAKAARIRAQELRQLVDRGVDPLATRQAERSAAVMGELLDLYLDQPKAKRSIADDRAMITAYIRPRWQHHRVADIRVEDVEALHLDLTKAGKATRANRVLSLCSTLFNLAVKKRWRVDNPCVSISRNRENKRERYLSLEEIGRLVAVLGSWPDVRSAVAVKLLLLLGCRRGELVRAR